MHFGKREKSKELDSYLHRTSRPIYSLILVFILIVIYEAGLSMLSPDFFCTPLEKIPGMVVTFAWVRNLLLSFHVPNMLSWVGTPLVVILALVVVQVKSKEKTEVCWTDIPIIFVEATILTIPLLVCSACINFIASNYSPSYVPVPPIPNMSSTIDWQTPEGAVMTNIISGIGAGIYEEFFFRLFFISMATLLFEKVFGMPRIRAIMGAVIISSLLFSAHHYVYFLDGGIRFGEEFRISTFAFRFMAGLYLAIVFGTRGFGIAAVTHAIHNIIPTFLMS